MPKQWTPSQAIEEFDRRKAALVAEGKDPTVAVATIARKDPELHNAYIAATQRH